jgi:hypothetical protein
MDYIFIIASFFFLISGQVANTFAQDSTIHPYVGTSCNILGVSNLGWGIELGFKYDLFYLGVEYGNYGHIDDSRLIVPLPPIPIIDSQTITYAKSDPHVKVSHEQYYAICGGIAITNNFWLGSIVLFSQQSSVHPVEIVKVDLPFTWETVTSTWIDFGIDMRYKGWNHLLFDIAFSHRRGLKTGLGYIL